MFRFSQYISVSLCIIHFGCKSPVHQSEEVDIIVESNTDSVKTISVKYAKGFSIEHHAGFKIVNVLNQWSDNAVGFRYILVKEGVKVPEEYKDDQVISFPIKNMICLSSTNLAFADKLNELHKVLAVDNMNYINNPKAIEMFEEGKLKEVGSEANVNIEFVIDLDPDIIFTFGTANMESGVYGKLREVGMNVGIFGEWMENTPLGRLEWIKFLACFLDKDEFASQIFNEIESEYWDLEKKVHDIKERPTVFTGRTFKDIWWLSGGDSYIGNYLKDAGADYLWKDDSSKGGLKSDFESVYDKAFGTDYWICNTTNWNTLGDIINEDSRYGAFNAFKKGNVYNNILRVNDKGANDYWESGLVNPNWVLADMIKIFHPDVLPEHEFVFFSRLNK